MEKAARVRLTAPDEELLTIELGGLELDFDLNSIGFDTADIDRMLGAFDTSDTEAAMLELTPSLRVAPPGDLWCLGEHKLYCGDALLGRATGH